MADDPGFSSPKSGVNLARATGSADTEVDLEARKAANAALADLPADGSVPSFLDRTGKASPAEPRAIKPESQPHPQPQPEPHVLDAAPEAPRTDADEAMRFLKALRPDGPWVLTAIIPDGKTDTRTFDDEPEARAYIEAQNKTKNLYFTGASVGQPKKKPSKADVTGSIFLHVDSDPEKGEEPAVAKARIRAAYEAQDPPPSIIIDSGNGLQGLWLLEDEHPIPRPAAGLEGAALKAAVDAGARAIEDRNRVLAAATGAPAGTHNVDRLLRLPGTINYPNKAKREAGRVACQARIISLTDERYPLGLFSEVVPEAPAGGKTKGNGADHSARAAEPTKIELDWAKVAEHDGWLKPTELPTDFSPKGRIIVEHKGSLSDLVADLESAGLVEKAYTSWSDVSLALAAILKADGRYPMEQIAAALMCDLECNQHILKHKDEKLLRRAVERCLNRSHNVQRIARLLPWRECDRYGRPVPSLYNARLVIVALGVECSFDTFHIKMLFGFGNEEARHALADSDSVDDSGIIRLRQMISARFGFDMGDKYTRDGVISLALEHCFNPVCDMLDQAQANWDGVERLDSMAVVYLNCEDTPLNRAIVRIMMIAAVRRARHPGCKFDTIVVLESKEGWNKSTALLILAGAENFSDASILGKGGREVQEALAEIWIHENADLAGMKKADIDSVKAFASRQDDIARPAYGHFSKRQKRHSIEVGTINSTEYLPSQTGNRRFWPLTVLKMIDLEPLKRDRLQLWGEAAKYEAVGESITLDESMWPLAGAEQEKRRVKDTWEDLVENMPLYVDPQDHNFKLIHSEPADPKDLAGLIKIIYREKSGRENVASADVLRYVLQVSIDRQDPRHAMRLSTVMRLAGWERSSNDKVSIAGKQVRGYYRDPPAAQPKKRRERK